MSAVTWDMLDRFLAEQSDRAERALVECWLTDRPERSLHLAFLKQAVAETRPDTRVGRPRVVGEQYPPTVGSAGLPTSRTVLSAALVLIVGGVMWLEHTRSDRDRLTQPTELRVAHAPAGQRASFRLSDDTRVILGAASTLRYPPAIDNSTRTVELEGEAYFEVTRRGKRPFVVRARGVEAISLGTEFVIKAYAEDAAPLVVVRRGRVGLRSATADRAPDQPVILPGQQGRLTAEGKVFVGPADTSALFAWTQGWLVFDSLPLRDAAMAISRWYDLDVRLADTSLGSIPLTATFRNQPTDEVLALLATSLGIHQVRRGRIVTFGPAPARIER
jgi:ferric-dicitrate binding protein FerR (iron transport regulator)